MANLDYPSITATTIPGQMEQVRRYLFQFTERLNWMLSTMEKSGSGGLRLEQNNRGKVEVKEITTFEELKDLIISNADIVQRFATAAKNIYDGSGAYVAQSDFGVYKEAQKTLLDVDTENGVTLLMTEVQRIEVDDHGEEWKYRGCVRIGKVTTEGDQGEVYGVSVGQVVEHNGTRTYTTSARYKSDGLDLFDGAGRRVAYIKTDEIGDSKLFIEDAEITGTLTLGGYVTDTKDGVEIYWKE